MVPHIPRYCGGRSHNSMSQNQSVESLRCTLISPQGRRSKGKERGEVEARNAIGAGASSSSLSFALNACYAVSTFIGFLVTPAFIYGNSIPCSVFKLKLERSLSAPKLDVLI